MLVERFINDYTALFGIIFENIKKIIFLPKSGFIAAGWLVCILTGCGLDGRSSIAGRA
jgi:hypothetical protein